MKKTLELQFDATWVLSHRDDAELPVSALRTKLSALGFECGEGTFTELSVTFDGAAMSAAEAEQRIRDAFNALYPEEPSALTIAEDEEDADEEEADESDADESDADDENEARRKALEARRQELLRRLRASFGPDDDEEEFEDDEGEDDEEGGGADAASAAATLAKIGSLVGAKEFKALAREIADIAPEIVRTGTQEVFLGQCYLFSIGDGCGLTTYLTLLARLIGETGLCKMGGVREEKLGHGDDDDAFRDAKRALWSGSRGRVGLVCIDISERMGRTDSLAFKDFLRTVEKHSESAIVVFRVPFVEKDVLARIRYSIGDLLNVRTVSFPPFGQEEIRRFARSEMERYHFSLTKSAWDCFSERITEEKSDGRFYGINTVKKVVKELVYQKELQNARRGTQDTVIGGRDAKKLCAREQPAGVTGEEMLSRLVGSESVKQQIAEIVAQIELALQSGGERPCLHMRFVGNPGTGKTTVARILGKILKERGVLRIGNFFECAGRDLCGRYVGETAPKTASICRDAYGSVLFIDEAYSLYRGDDGSRDYGREALDTLIAEMENHRGDFVVIMAGYPDEMATLMEGNAGLASRMPYTLEFPNFTREQLGEIFASMVRGHFACDEQLLPAAAAYFMALPDEFLAAKKFSNARFVRNIFERTWAKAAMRCQLAGKQTVTLTKEDFEHASAEKDFAVSLPKKLRLGF